MSRQLALAHGGRLPMRQYSLRAVDRDGKSDPREATIFTAPRGSFLKTSPSAGGHRGAVRNESSVVIVAAIFPGAPPRRLVSTTTVSRRPGYLMMVLVKPLVSP
jgi:hypothetical protein